jgi:hypothetical protein
MARLDSYTFQARIAPVFIVVLPIFICITNLWSPEALTVQYGISSFLVSALFSIFAGAFGRNAGKQIENKLWKSWDGPPTTRFLRHSDTKFNSIRRARCHKNLQLMIKDIRIPTSTEEKNNPMEADQVYEACTRFLIGKTRDIKKYPLIYKENVNYGFLRNLLGLKIYGIICSVISVLLSTWVCWKKWTLFGIYHIKSTVILIISLLFFVGWVFWVRPKAVKIVAEAYAERLLEFCEQDPHETIK